MDQDEISLQMTGDGSHTLYVHKLDEYYHSWHGAIQESRHVFIERGLHQVTGPRVRLLEIGFGTGLNAYLTCIEAEKLGIQVDYHSIELYPLSGELFERLNYSRLLGKRAGVYQHIHEAGWNEQQRITPFFCIYKILGDFLKFQPEASYQLIYFDAFAPVKQPGMWEKAQLLKLFWALVSGGILVTYCAKGQVKRILKEIGFYVESLPGPPGKREMVRAFRP